MEKLNEVIQDLGEVIDLLEADGRLDGQLSEVYYKACDALDKVEDYVREKGSK